MQIGLGKQTRRAYGFDEIALVPGSKTVDMELCDITTHIGSLKLASPIIASGNGLGGRRQGCGRD
jgi:IMP dehydrogenase